MSSSGSTEDGVVQAAPAGTALMEGMEGPAAVAVGTGLWKGPELFPLLAWLLVPIPPAPSVNGGVW